jgi:hypothetical protein
MPSSKASNINSAKSAAGSSNDSSASSLLDTKTQGEKDVKRPTNLLSGQTSFLDHGKVHTSAQADKAAPKAVLPSLLKAQQRRAEHEQKEKTKKAERDAMQATIAQNKKDTMAANASGNGKSAAPMMTSASTVSAPPPANPILKSKSGGILTTAASMMGFKKTPAPAAVAAPSEKAAPAISAPISAAPYTGSSLATKSSASAFDISVVTLDSKKSSLTSTDGQSPVLTSASSTLESSAGGLSLSSSSSSSSSSTIATVSAQKVVAEASKSYSSNTSAKVVSTTPAATAGSPRPIKDLISNGMYRPDTSKLASQSCEGGSISGSMSSSKGNVDIKSIVEAYNKAAIIPPAPSMSPTKPVASPSPRSPITLSAINSHSTDKTKPTKSPLISGINPMSKLQQQQQQQHQVLQEKATPIKAEKEEESVQYEIEDRDDSDDSGSGTDDDDESDQKKKKQQSQIPEWAKGANLREALERQYGLHGHTAVDPDDIFFEVQTCSLEAIFGCREGLTRKYNSRSSSAHWDADQITLVEKRAYRTHMGFGNAALV